MMGKYLFCCIPAADSSLSDCFWWFIGNHVWKTELPFFGSATFSLLLISPTPTVLGEMIDGRLAAGGSGRYLLPSFRFCIFASLFQILHLPEVAPILHLFLLTTLEKVVYLFFSLTNPVRYFLSVIPILFTHHLLFSSDFFSSLDKYLWGFPFYNQTKPNNENSLDSPLPLPASLNCCPLFLLLYITEFPEIASYSSLACSHSLTIFCLCST